MSQIPQHYVQTVLERARLLLSEKSSWTKGKTATDRRGRSVEATTDEAARFCAVGALQRASFLYVRELAHDRLIPYACVPDMRTPLHRQKLYEAAERELNRTLNDQAGTLDTSGMRSDVADLVTKAASGATAVHTPWWNDHLTNGYEFVTSGLDATIERLRGGLAGLSKRAAAAKKGWDTRRARMAKEAAPAQEPPPMVFGGTLPPTDTSTNTTKKEVAA